jgi:Ni/Fe-hydrogenase 1 B-type cytochrome subunit
MGTISYKEVYVWQLPVRFYHWMNALCIVILAATGYLIGRPIAIVISSEASFSYWFGTVRFVHFVAAFIFFFNFVFRLYWGFVGNKYSRWTYCKSNASLLNQWVIIFLRVLPTF